MNFRIFLTVCTLVCVTSANPQDSGAELKRSLRTNCDSEFSITCFKMDIIAFIEGMSTKKEFNLLPGVTVTREPNPNSTKNSELVAEMARSFPNDPEKRLDGFLFAKLSNFLQSHSLRLQLLDSNSVTEARSAFEARKGKIGGKKGGLEGLLAAAMMMKGTLMAVGLGALALLAGKALMTALMALMLSAIVGLKALTSGGHKSTTYEIVAKPVYSHSNSHSASHEDYHGGGGHSGGGGYSGGSGGWSRSLNFDLPEHLKQA